MISNVVINDVYIPYIDLQTRIQIFYGGSSSGKSYFMAQRTILDMLKGERNFLICRNVATTIRKSIFNEIVKAISNMELNKFFKINSSDLYITCLLNDYQILFCGLDDVEKVKSITPKKGVITDIIVEEATEIEYRSYKQLLKRLRGKINLNKRMTLLFNPIYNTHWIYKEFFTKWDDKKNIYQDAKVFILKTWYIHNRFLAKDDIAELENETDKYYYDVYTLGNWGVLGNVIFKNWVKEDLKDHKFDNCNCGLDFGFGADPVAWIKTKWNKGKNTLYILNDAGGNGLSDLEMMGIIKQNYDDELIIADSAEPKSIKYYAQNGFRIQGAKKGKGSLEFGYKWLMRIKIVVDIRCQNTINELTIHKWREDRNGNALPVPEDRNNHWIDALRYCNEFNSQDQVGSGVY